MTLEEFVREKKQELLKFRLWYLRQHVAAKEGEFWPLHESPGFWDEQFQMFDPDQVSSSEVSDG